MYSNQEIQQFFDAETFKRGQKYAQQGKVKEIVFYEEGVNQLQIEARVLGQYDPVYQVRIWLDPADDFELTDNACTCPMGGDCKHVVAALIVACGKLGNPFNRLTNALASPKPDVKSDRDLAQAVATEQLRQEEQALDQWLKQLQIQLGAPVRQSSECLLYVLAADRYGIIRLCIYKTRRCKDGSYADPRHYSNAFQVSLGWNRPGFITDSDERVLLNLRSQSGWSWDGSQILGMAGAEMLRLAVRTGRCYWDNWQSPPLDWGATRDAQLGWQRTEKGKLLPALEGLDPGVRVIHADPLLYVDPSQHYCGELQLPLAPAQVSALLAAPALSPSTLSLRLPQLAPLLENLAVPPPPDVIAPLVRTDLKPQPYLFLHGIAPNRRSKGPVLRAMTAHFRYDEHRAPWLSIESHIRVHNGDDLVLIQRDAEAEDQARRQLKDFRPLYAQFGWQALEHERSLDLTASDDSRWLDFLAYRLPVLEREGWQIEFDQSFPLNVVESDDWYGETTSRAWDGWFDLELGILHEGRRLNLVPLLMEGLRHLRYTAREEGGGLELPEHLWLHDGKALLRVPSERVRPLLEILQELFRERPLDAQGRLAVSPVDGARVLGDSETQWTGGESLRGLAALLKDFQGLPETELATGFQAQLRSYQRQGLDWMQFLRQGGLGGLLADDMGLGKTIQTLAHVWTEKAAGRLTQPALVICPTSLLPNWRSEAAKFAPELRVLTLHGQRRKDSFAAIAEHDLILTTYALLSRDEESLKAHEFHVLVFDEAQNLKNPRTRMAAAAKSLRGGHRLALTGTPMENHLGELWSLFNLLLPGFLGNSQEFQRLFRAPIEQQGSAERRAILIRRIKPFLLRRTKEEVTPELPAKTEIVRKVELEGAQRDLYETIRIGMDQKVNQLLAEKGLAGSHIEILDALLKLRQTCCDPRLLPNSLAPKKAVSGKLAYLMELLPSLVEEGRRVLLFSQFTSMLKLIEAEVQKAEIPYVVLTGETRDRATPVERFQNGEVPLFLISLKAGGIGLNLVAADVVIHYDPWWNPAVENQATDRAYRIGQDKPVFVYKLICEGTVEERMLAFQASKSALADSVYGKEGAFTGALSAEDVRALFQPLESG